VKQYLKELLNEITLFDLIALAIILFWLFAAWRWG
jgi:hypothetical protein